MTNIANRKAGDFYLPQIFKPVSMILVDYSYDGAKHFAFMVGEALYECVAVQKALPASSDIFLENVDRYLPMMEHMHEQLLTDIRQGRVTGLHVTESKAVKVIVWPDRTVNAIKET